MNYRCMNLGAIVLAGLVACGGGGGGTSASAGGSTSTGPGVSTTSGGSTGPVTTSVTGTGGASSGSGGASDSDGSSSGAPTTGTPGTSSSGGATDPGTSSSGGSSSGGSSGTSGGSSSGGSTGSSGGEMCVGQAGSCAQGQLCCDGLECCAGVPVPMGQEFCGEMCPKSDRNVKRELRAVDAAEVLRRLVALDIGSWEYKKDPPDIRHLGPMAQDFKQAFGLGAGDTTIFPLDASGVAMVAIQALHAENAALRERVEQLERRMAALAGP
jgi:hypothetical protein